jgi:GxxExxY protein
MDYNTPEKIVGLALNVHRGPGPGMPEHAYEHCFAGELAEDGMPYERQAPMPLNRHASRRCQPRYRVDLVINGKLIVELKGNRLEDAGSVR